MTYHLPLFPLPKAVLFPRTHLPLHVFEPRYVAMMEAVMAGDQKLGIAQLREGYEKDYFGAPSIHRVFTTARILYADKIEDERWNILVEGVERVELIKEVQTTPFRVAQVDPIREVVEPPDRSEVFRLMNQIALVSEAISNHVQEGRRSLTNLVNTHQHPAVVCDVASSLLVSDPYARQSLLEERNLLRRMKLLDVQLQTLAHELKTSGYSMEDLPPKD